MIRKTHKARAIFITKIILTWISAWIMFYFLRQYGIEELPYIELAFEPNKLHHVSTHLALGLLTGFIYGTLELAFERPFFQKLSYGYLISIKVITYLLLACLLMTFAVIVFQHFRFGATDWSRIVIWLGSANFSVALVYFITVSLLISFFRQMNYKFGPGVLWNMILGKYRQPREEDRIFMFLDLRSSTSFAQELGHIKFSQLLQDCFFDLTEVILNREVDIYQYVGDEAVLSWPTTKGLKNNNCIHAYFDYQRKLERKRNYYESKYGHLPFFKGGLHLGKVIVAEVGVIKKEIAYHGQVLNMTARIQGRCNELNQGLLISQSLKDQLINQKEFKVTDFGHKLLRGIQDKVAISGIEEIR